MSNSGIVTQHFDPAVRPQDDLFAHVNGRWLKEHQIPPDRGSDGAFRELRDQAERQVRMIVEAADGKVEGDNPEAHEERLIATLYASFMDSHRIDILGTGPLKDELAAVAAVAEPPELARLIGRLERVGVSGVFDSWVDTDPGDPDRYIVNLGQGGLGLPDESYYRSESAEEIRAQYIDHIARLLRLAQVEADAGRVMALETALARVHWDVVKVRDDSLTYNPSIWTRLVQDVPQFPWAAWAEGLGAPAGALDELVVRQPGFFAGLGQLWADTPLEDWRAWLAWQVVHARAPYLADDFVQANFDFYGRVFSGAQELRQRWKRGLSLVENCVGQAVGRRYVQQHFPPEHKAKMQVLVDHLLAAYRQSIQDLDWLGPETKAKALAKLELFRPKIGYPERWRDYSQLHVQPLDLVGNVRAVCAWETDRELAKIGRPVDRDEWFMTPQTVNAYYNQGMNEIVFPAAILRPPFFDAEADEACNYGAIGAVIGHEIGHGFDDQGSKHDGWGRLADWWTEADRAAFEARTAALVAQYDGFALDLPDGPHPVNGALTIGENIGDLGGLAIAWRAYLMALDGAEPPLIDGLSAGRRFFFGWAQSWRGKTRPEEAALNLTVDPHSPDVFRCNGVVRNLDQFHQTFATTEQDGLWLAPERRVSIW